MALRRNTAEGQASGTALTVANSGGGSGDAFNTGTAKAGTATMNFDNAQKMHGTQSYRIICPATTDTALMLFNGANAPAVAGQMYFCLNALPGVAEPIMRLRSTGQGATVIITSLNKLAVQNAANTVLSTFATSLSVGIWYRLELEVIKGTTTSNGTIKCRYCLGDSAVAQDTAFASATANTGIINFTDAHFGKITSGGTINFWVDDLAFDDTSSNPIGPWVAAGPGKPVPPKVLNSVTLDRSANW